MARGVSLHVGVNEFDPSHYGSNGKLNACEADARSMRAIADACGFRATELLTKAATRGAVTSFLEGAAADLAAGDLLLVTYSGHGGQLPDRNGDETDREDETWCLYDAQLMDDELYRLYGQLRAGVRCVVLSDSCHSGTVLKKKFYEWRVASGLKPVDAPLTAEAAPKVAKFPPRELARSTYETNKTFYDAIIQRTPKDGEKTDIPASVLLISGCQDNQYSFDGTFNSAFTAEVLNVWNNGKFQGDYRDFHGAVQARCEPTQSPNYYTIGRPMPEFYRQRPFTI